MGCPHQACVWNLKTGEPWDKNVDEAGHMGTFSPDSSMVAFSNGKIRDAQTGEIIRNINLPSICYTVRFSPDSKYALLPLPMAASAFTNR